MQSLVTTNRWKWSKLAASIKVRDGHRCQIGSSVCTRIATEVDHIRPRIAGGGDEPTNLRAVCHPCHVTRGMEDAPARPVRHSYGSPASGVLTRDYTRGR